MTARRDFCALLGLGALGLAGCDTGNGVGASAVSTRMRVLNLIPNALGMTLTLDSDPPFVSGLPFQGLTGYMDVTSGVREFKVSVDNGASNLVDTSLGLAVGVDYLYVVFGPVEAAHSLLVLDTTVLFPDGGTFALRVINLATSVPSVDIYLTAPGVDLSVTGPVIKGAPYTAVGFLTPVDTATYELRITPNNIKDVIFDALNVSFVDKSLVEIVVYGTGSSRLVRAAVLTIGSDVGQTYDSLIAEFKFVNASSVASPLNVFVDGALSLANVPFAGVSNYQTTLAGPRSISIQASATPGADLLTIDTTLIPASDTSIVVSGPAGALRGLVLADNNLPAAVGRARIRFVNASPDLAAMDVYVSFFKQFAGVATNTSSPYADLAADPFGNTSYEFDFNIAGTTALVLQLPGVVLLSGKTYSIYVVGPVAALQGVVVADD